MTMAHETRQRSSTPVTSSLAALVAAASLGFGGSARAADAPLPAPSATEYSWIVPTAADALGANNSHWVTIMRGRNPSSSVTAQIEVKAHPRGQAPSSSDYSMAFSRLPGEAFELSNLISFIRAPSGAYWVEVTSNVDLGLPDTLTGNLSSDGAYQASAIPTLSTATLGSDPRITHGGDLRSFVLGDNATKRFSYIVHNASDVTATIELSLLNQGGYPIGQGQLDVPAHTTQQSYVSDLVGAIPVGTNTLRTMTRATDPSTEVNVFESVSETDNVVTTKQDTSLSTGTVSPLLTSRVVTVGSTPTIEQNDTYTQVVSATSRPGTIVYDVLANPPGATGNGWTWGQMHGTTNTLTYHDTFTAQTIGPLSIKARINVADERGNIHRRELTSDIVNVIAEQDGYIASAADVKAYYTAAPNEFAMIMSRGGWGGENHLTYSAAKALLPTFFDGISGFGNPELKQIVIGDQGNGYPGGNTILFQFQDGTSTALYNLAESDLDHVKTVTKAKLP